MSEHETASSGLRCQVTRGLGVHAGNAIGGGPAELDTLGEIDTDGDALAEATSGTFAGSGRVSLFLLHAIGIESASATATIGRTGEP